MSVPSTADHVRSRLADVEAELNRLAVLPGKLSGPQSSRWRSLSDEYAELEATRADLDDRADRAAAAAVAYPSTTGRTRGPSGDEDRDTAMRNIERSTYLSDDSKHSATQVVDAARYDPA